MRWLLICAFALLASGCTVEQHEDWAGYFDKIAASSQASNEVLKSEIVKGVAAILPPPVEAGRQTGEFITYGVGAAALALAEWQRRKAKEAKRERNLVFNKVDGATREKVVATAKEEKSLLLG